MHEILHQLQNSEHQVNEMKAGSVDDFITNGDQVQQKRPVEHKTSTKVSPEMKKKLAQLIEDYADIFSKNQYDIGESTHPPIEIPTEGPPCISAPYTIPLKFRPWADNTLNKLLEAGMIQCTMSTWASPVIIVPKKGLQANQGNSREPLPIDAKLRMCCDYCKLNSKLPADFWNHDKQGRRIVKQGINAPYPLPRIDEMFDTIQGKRYLTTLDCTGTFHGLKLSPDAAKKSAFITHLGKFEWKVAPFGLALLPSYYSKAMQETLSGLEDFARNYMDDVIISSFTETEHLEHIRQVFQRFRDHKMKLKLAKCEFLRDKIQFLGHVIDHKGIHTIPEKTKEISKIKSPANVDEAKAFLGVLNYYCRFIPAFADLMHPIQKQLKRNVKFSWTTDCENAFNLAKKRLSQDPMLYHPDPGKPWIIKTDASKTAIAGILLQPHDVCGTTREVPVTFFSYNLTGTQQSWSATKRELYAIYVAVRKLHYLIYGGRITIRMDHKPLLDIVSGTAKTQNSAAAKKLHRWT